MTELVSSAEAARILGVSQTSIKRWADEGVLDCARTAGHHRRFERAALERFRQSQSGTAALSDHERWMRLLLDGPAQALEARLLDERAQRGSFAQVADSLAPLLAEVGRRWATGDLCVVDEHLASERLARALARLSEWLPSRSLAPRALLAAAEAEEHTLGLSLAELTLRELGWTTLWAGRRVPTAELVRRLSLGPVELVVLSASSASLDQRALAHQARRMERACRETGAALVLGGGGAWPDQPSTAVRLNQFRELAELGRVLLLR